MEFDKTSIVLRQRSTVDLIDLSLVVLRVYCRPIFAYASLGIFPAMLLNAIVLFPLADFEAMVSTDFTVLDEASLHMRYLGYLIATTMIEAPLFLIGVTYFLGQAVFLEHPSWKEFVAAFRQVFLRLLLVLGIFRFALLAPLIVLWVPDPAYFQPGLEVFWLGMVLTSIIAAFRMLRPFAPEILVLERCPFRRRHLQKTAATYWQRSRRLHSPIASELMGRGIAMTLAMVTILVILTLGELFVLGIFAGTWRWGWWMDFIFFPLNIWLICLWGSVFRFLSYLECRTRLEGWELELRLRAEAHRLLGEVGA